MIEDVVIVGGLVGVQFLYAGSSQLLSYLMSLGLNPLTVVIFSTFVTFLILSPISFYFERTQWPKTFSLKLISQLVLISFGGVTLFQTLFLKGIKLSSPAMATAMPNLAPGLIFFIAWTFRLEKVNLSCIYSKVKILGTLLCVVGALVMSIMHSISKTASMDEVASASYSSPPSPSPNPFFDRDKILGCLYLMAATFALSSNVILQAITMVDFPAPISLCAITSLIGVFLTAVLELILDHKLDLGKTTVSVRDFIAYSILGGIMGGSCFSFNNWALKKKGPVLVSMFSPIATVFSVILSVLTVRDSISLGSIAGMLIMFTGLYFVLWAKGKEGCMDEDRLEPKLEAEKPLLS